jgi:hypothetical protein
MKEMRAIILEFHPMDRFLWDVYWFESEYIILYK